MGPHVAVASEGCSPGAVSLGQVEPVQFQRTLPRAWNAVRFAERFFRPAYRIAWREQGPVQDQLTIGT